MATNIAVRKRLRSASTECAFIGQSKQFVNQRLVEQNDADQMKKIYKKTVGLLFKGATAHYSHLLDGGHLSDTESQKNRFQQIRMQANGNFITVMSGQKPVWIPDVADRKCLGCRNEARVHGDCLNCNLELCEYCGYSCGDCNEPLCVNCVAIFECGTPDGPCCSRCQFYH